MTIRRKIQNCVVRLGRATARFDHIKSLLHLHDIVYFFLEREVSECERQKVLSSLRSDIIQTKIQHAYEAGVQCIHIYILLVESLGDIIAAEPIARRLTLMAKTCKIHWIVRKPFAEVLAAHPSIAEVITVDSLAEGKDFCAQTESISNIIVDCHLSMSFCTRTNRIFPKPYNQDLTGNTYYSIGNLVETFALAAGLPKISDAPIFHLSSRAKPLAAPTLPYIAIQCHSNDTSRDWDSSKWNQLIRALISNGWNVVELGTPKTITIEDAHYYDCTGIKSVQDIALTIKNASAFIGVDSGFAHIANAFHTPSVLIFGKFRTWTNHIPYSGTFAQSSQFKIIRAAKNYASSVPVSAIINAFAKLNLAHNNL